MARESERLTVKGKNGVETLAKQTGMHADGDGLYLRVNSDSGQCSWVLRYMLHGKARWMGLGPYPLIPLADARTRARDARRLLVDKIDPINVRHDDRAKAKLETASNKTFAECSLAYIDAHRASWKNAKHAAQWPSTLKTYAYPVIGTLPVRSIDTAMVLKVLKPIWTEKPETAKRLRGRIESVLDYATVAGYRQGLNPARWKGHLSHMLAKPSAIRPVEHHAALPYAELPAFMAKLRNKEEGVGARALEFLILTATRTGEVLGARWSEINLRGKLWTIPAARMKAGKEHVVPLSPRAVEILEGLKPDAPEGFVFPGRDGKKPLSNMAFLMLLRRMGRDDLTGHGFRSTFRDWAGDRSAFDHQTIEFALAHGISDKTEAAYRRGTAIEKRGQLMAHWADYCASPAKHDAAKVVPIREAAL
jgi:integrase